MTKTMFRITILLLVLCLVAPSPSHAIFTEIRDSVEREVLAPLSPDKKVNLSRIRRTGRIAVAYPGHLIKLAQFDKHSTPRVTQMIHDRGADYAVIQGHDRPGKPVCALVCVAKGDVNAFQMDACLAENMQVRHAQNHIEFFQPANPNVSWVMEGTDRIRRQEKGASADIGMIVRWFDKVIVKRDGKTTPMDPKDTGVRASDTIQTDGTGWAQIEFIDGSSVTLSNDTALNLLEYADVGKNSSFKASILTGMMRTITGKIVEQNPSGFKMSAPTASIGIRGSTLTILVEGKGKSANTTVFVEDTKRQVHVNKADVPSGFKWIHFQGKSRQERMTDQDRQFINRTFVQPARRANHLPENRPLVKMERRFVTPCLPKWEIQRGGTFD